MWLVTAGHQNCGLTDDGDEGSPSGDPALGVVAAGKRRQVVR